MPEADVSVIIPAYNAARYVATAIDSALAQTSKPREIIVIDDGSTDGTEAVVQAYGTLVRYERQENSGVAAARNSGIAASTCRYVAFLDADDVWLPRKLEVQIQVLQAGSSRAAHTAQLVVDEELQPLFEHRSPRRASAIRDLLEVGNVVGTPSTVLCERALFAEVGGFDAAFSLCADWEMWIRIAAVTDFAYADEPLVKYRLHANNMSRDVELLETDSELTLEKAFRLPSLDPSLRGLRRRSFARNSMVLAGSYFRAGRLAAALRCAASSIARDPRQIMDAFSFAGRMASGRMGQRSVSQRSDRPLRVNSR